MGELNSGLQYVTSLIVGAVVGLYSMNARNFFYTIHWISYKYTDNNAEKKTSENYFLQRLLRLIVSER